jgi:hypothetical protein
MTVIKMINLYSSWRLCCSTYCYSVHVMTAEGNVSNLFGSFALNKKKQLTRSTKSPRYSQIIASSYASVSMSIICRHLIALRV